MNNLQQKLLLNTSFSRFYNDSGKIRLARVRSELENSMISHTQLIELYQEWRDFSEFMVLARPDSHEYCAVKCSKRGNDVYNWRLDHRFQALDALAEQLGDDRIFDINQDKPKTNVLFVTLTFDTKLCNESNAWERIGKDWNKWKARLTKKYGKISTFRAWESFKNGYPHIHAILVFRDHEFDVYESKQDETGKTKYRITEKKEFEKSYHSYVDVVGVSSLGGSVRYLTKYLRKEHTQHANITQAQMWINRKQSFSLSKDFAESLRLVYKNLHNSNPKYEQTNLEGESIEKPWQFVGIFSKEQIEKLVFDRGKLETHWLLKLKNLDGLKIGYD